MAKAVEAREARGVEHGDDLLGQLQFLNERVLSILADAERSGDRRGALAAIREARGLIELNGKLTGELVERHAHLHGHQMLTPEAHEQFIQGVALIQEFTERCLPQGDVRDDVHVLSGADALPRPADYGGIDKLPSPDFALASYIVT